MAQPGSSSSYSGITAGFEGRRALVIGDAILDEYLVGDCSRISPEAPVPIVRVKTIRHVPGGAGNTAANIVSLGGQATLIGYAGADEGGAALRFALADAGIDFRPVDDGRATLRKTRVVSHQQQIVRLDHEPAFAPEGTLDSAVLAHVEGCLSQAHIVVISDYAKGLLSSALTRAIIQRAHRSGLSVIIDPRPQNRDFYMGSDYLTPNWKEARALLGLPETEATEDAVRMTARSLAREFGAHIILTLGPHGIAFCSADEQETFSQPTMAKEIFDVSGAGDTVVAAFALARASGADHPTSVAIANRAASVVVGKFGTATVTLEEMLQEEDTAARLVQRQALSQLAASLRVRGRRVVTINGSFDVLHAGHLHILNEARRCGDVLIVGLNSDASVRSYKGPQRPIIGERQRADMLLALRAVDYVHIFDEPDPIAFLQEIRPDVHVNGAEYGKECVESETVTRGGGRLHIVDRVPGLSTTGLLDALQAAGGARP